MAQKLGHYYRRRKTIRHWEALAAQFERVRLEVLELRAENKKLKTRMKLLQVECAKHVDISRSRDELNDHLLSIVSARSGGRLRMAESYEGVVEDVHDDRVLVVYDVAGKIVEQTYEKGQFLDGRLPDVGTRLAVFVNVVEVPLESDDSDVEEIETRGEPTRAWRTSLSGEVVL